MSKYFRIAKMMVRAGTREVAAQELIRELIKGTKYDNHVFVAGGAVRDEVMGLDPKDIDITVSLARGRISLAEFIAKRLGIYREGSNPVIFKNFGTAKITLNGVKYKGQDLTGMDIEFVHTRKEKYEEDSRKPETSFGTPKDDVERRDLTINSLLKNLTTGEILDLTGKGLGDIKNGIIRTPLDANIIFREDPLRLLRVVRFSVRYGWKIVDEVLEAMKKNAYRLEIISAERIRDELNKIITSKHPKRGIELLRETGLLKYVIPELEEVIEMSQNKYHDKTVYYHILDVMEKIPNNLISRLSALLHDIGKAKTREVIDNEVHFYRHEEVSAEMVETIMRRLKYPNDIIEKVKIAVGSHMRGKNAKDFSDKAVRKLVKDLGEHLENTLDLIHADNLSHHPDYVDSESIPQLKERIKNLNEKIDINTVKLPLNGKEIMELLGIKPGKEVGRANEILKDELLENPELSKEEAKKVLLDRF